MIEKTISESAFLINESRSRRVDISNDIYSYLWVTKNTKKIWNDFSKIVYPYDDIQISLRNRFFLETLKDFIRKIDNPVFINFASGFTSYPFLINKKIKSIEIDLEYIIKFKQRKIKEWIKLGLLPEREINFINCDLGTESDVLKLKNNLKPILEDKKSFIMLEGITYYLSKKSFFQILDIISELQSTGSILTLDFWKKDYEKHPVFIRFKKFFSDYFNFDEKSYNFIDNNDINKIKDYKIIDITDIQELEEKYLDSYVLSDFEKILPEYYIVLEKI